MLVTIPLPTGSPTCTKTIGIVRVSWSTAAVRGVDSVTIRLGCKSTSSFANLRTKSASELDQRRSSRMLRPSVHPKSCSRLRSAAIRACPSASVSGNDPSTPMRRVPSGCCAPAASGHATAAPPSATSNSRRAMVTRACARRVHRPNVRSWGANRTRRDGGNDVNVPKRTFDSTE